MDEGMSPPAFHVSAGRAGQVVLRVVGEIDAAAAPAFRNRLDQVTGGDVDEVVVHLADVTFMDASGLAVLARGRRRLEGTGARLRIASPSHAVIRLLHVAGLDGWLVGSAAVTPRSG